jgi:flagellar protein FlbD
MACLGLTLPGRLGWLPSRTNLMIQLTRLNNKPLAVNSDLIKFVEQAPDTVITLINGEKIVVLENAEQVLQRILQFRREILRGAWPAPTPCLSEPESSEPPPPTEQSGS